MKNYRKDSRKKKSLNGVVFLEPFSSTLNLIIQNIQENLEDSEVDRFSNKFSQICDSIKEIDEICTKTLISKKNQEIATETFLFWTLLSNEMMVQQKLPHRISYINTAYIELVRVSKSMMETTKKKSKNNDLYQELFDEFSVILDSYMNCFDMLLKNGEIDEEIMKKSNEKSQSLIDSFLVKYAPFCYADEDESLTEFYTYTNKSLNKIVKNTNTILQIGDDPLSLNPLFAEMDKLFTHLFTTIGFTKPKDTSQQIDVKKAKYFDKVLRERINKVDNKHTSSTIKPWYIPPMFSDLKSLSDNMKELSGMSKARKVDQVSSSVDNQNKNYGINEVFNETLKALKWRTDKVQKSTKSLENYSEVLKKEVSEFNVDNEYLTNVLEVVTKENERIKSEKAETQSELNDIFSVVLTKRAAYNKLVSGQQDRVGEINEELKKIAIEMNNLKNEKDRILDSQKEVKKEIKKSMKYNEALEEKRKSVLEEINNVEAEIIMYEKQLSDMKERPKQLQESYEEKRSKINKEIEEVDNALAIVSEERMALEKKVRKMEKKEIPNLEEELEILADDLFIYQRNIQTAKEESNKVLLSVIKAKLDAL